MWRVFRILVGFVLLSTSAATLAHAQSPPSCPAGEAAFIVRNIHALGKPNVLLATGTADLYATSQTDTPINFSDANGPVTIKPQHLQITNGAITPICVPLSNARNPYIFYHFTAHAPSSNRAIIDVKCISVTSSPFTLSTFTYPCTSSSGPPTSIEGQVDETARSLAQAAQSAVNGKVSKNGDVIQGPLILATDPTASMQAATKRSDGIANAVSAACSGSGCVVTSPPTYTTSEFPAYLAGNMGQTYTGIGTRNPDGTQIFDYRSGRFGHIFNNPPAQDHFGPMFVGEYTTDMRTKQQGASPGSASPAQYFTKTILQENFGNGSNDAVTGKTTVSTLGVFQYNYEQGQHITEQVQNLTHGIGDALVASWRAQSGGGYRNAFDEGTHLWDAYAYQDAAIYQGTCATGCIPGSTAISVTATSGQNTQGDGRILYDTAASDTSNFQVQQIHDSGPSNLMIAGNSASEFTKITPVGTTFAVSQITTLTAAVTATNFNPSTKYTLPVVNSAGFATGVACLADETYSAYSTFEWVNITAITDSTHIVATMKYSHPKNSVITQGGACGKVFAMQADAYQLSKPLRRIFPVMGSLDGSTLWVFSGASLQSGMISSFVNTSLGVASISRVSNVVTLTLPGNAPVSFDPTGMQVTVANASDSSFNGTFSVTGTSTAGPGRWHTLVWSQSGSDGSTTGETVNLQSHNATANLYYGAEVYSVLGANHDTTDNQFALSPNQVPFSNGTTLEEAQWMQQRVAETFMKQTVYFPDVISNDPVFGYTVNGLMNSQRVGYSINNATPFNLYAGHGGSYVAPKSFLYNGGLWNVWLTAQYAPESSVIDLPCKVSGCSGKNAAIGLVRTPNNGAAIQYDPSTFTWAWWIPADSEPIFTICCGTSNHASSYVGANVPLNVNAQVTATSFKGSAANLTSIPAAHLTGTVPVTSMPAFTGDCTSSAGSANLTCSGNSTQVSTQAVIAKPSSTSITVAPSAPSGTTVSTIFASDLAGKFSVTIGAGGIVGATALANINYGTAASNGSIATFSGTAANAGLTLYFYMDGTTTKATLYAQAPVAAGTYSFAYHITKY